MRAGQEHTCGVTTDNRAYCWGRNRSGQLGDGTDLTRGRPTPVAGRHRFSLIRTGNRHTCALTPAEKSYCWGENGLGAVGDGTTTDRRVPTAVVDGAGFKSLGLGAASSCGVRANGNAACWGHNGSGPLGDGTSTSIQRTPVAVVGGQAWARVNGGVTADHTCGLTTAGAVYCWGQNNRGQLGDGSTVNRNVPTPVQGS